MKSLCPQGRVVLHDVPEDRPPPIVIIGFGMLCVASPMRMPRPPQKMTTFKPLVGLKVTGVSALPHAAEKPMIQPILWHPEVATA